MSLDAALKAAAAQRTSDPQRQLVIELQAGVYQLDKPLVIDSRIAGEGGVTLRAAPGADVQLVGWKAVGPPLAQVPDHIERQLPESARRHVTYFSVAAAGIFDFGFEAPRGHSFARSPAETEFFANGRPLSPARWPARGYSEIVSAGSDGRVLIRDAPIAKLIGRTDVWFSGFPGADWRYQRVRVADVDAESGRIRIAQAPGYLPRSGDFASLEGAPSLFSAPGQYYLDRAGGVLAVWLPDATISPVHASILEHAIEIVEARNVRIEGLSILGVRGDGIRIIKGDGIRLTRIHVANAGMRGVAIEGGRNVTLENSVVHDTGDESVWLDAGDRQTLAPANHRITNNALFQFARRTRSGRAAISVDGVGNVIESNMISDGPSDGIRFQGNDHIIRNNVISRIVSECGDCGAIYTGQDWAARGSCVEANFIHVITPAQNREVKGIYLDDGASGVLVRRNVLVNVNRGVLVGGGRDNIISENIIMNANEYGVLVDARGLTWAARHVADPSSEIRRKLAAVPYDREPYRSRYQNLADILIDEPGVPKYNLISNNFFINGEGVHFEDARIRFLVRTSERPSHVVNGADEVRPSPRPPVEPFACLRASVN